MDLHKYTRVHSNVRPHELEPVLKHLYREARNARGLYATAKDFNSLLDWVPLEGDKQFAVVIMGYGLGCDRREYSEDELVQYTGYSRNGVQSRLSGSEGLLRCIARAHFIIQDRRSELLDAGNELKALGLSLKIWRPLVEPLYGYRPIRTVRELMQCSETDLEGYWRIGRDALQAIKTALAHCNLELKKP